MQNLPIQFTQTPPVKSGAVDAVSKVDPVSPAPNESFQNMLSRQVQIKQASTKQPANAQPANSQPKSAQPNADAAAQKNKSDVKAAQGQQAKDADANQAATDTVDIKSKVAVDADALTAKALGKDKDCELNADGSATSAVDPALAVQLLIPAIPVGSTVAAESGAQSDTDVVSKKAVSSLDTALNNALSQNKSGTTDAASKPENEALLDLKNSKDNSKVGADNTRWLDSVMSSAAKQAPSEELSAIKLAASSAKDINVKDIAAVPVYQPAALANTIQAAQQIGSTSVINATPGKTGWDEAISQKVVWMVGSGEQSASLTLNPPDMGPLQVVIHVHNDQADTTFISDNPEVRQALENGLATLRDKMSEAGIQLGQANINSGGQQAQQEFQRASQNRMASQPGQSGDASQSAEVENIRSSNVITRVANGLVDTFA